MRLVNPVFEKTRMPLRDGEATVSSLSGVDVVWLFKIEHAHRAFRGKHPIGVEACERPHHGAFTLDGIEPFPHSRPDIQTWMWIGELTAQDATCEFASLIVVCRCYAQTVPFGFVKKTFDV